MNQFLFKISKLLLVVLVWLSVQSQAFAQTTLEEYLYVTYGYKEQLNKGLDDKKGYSWKHLLQYKFSHQQQGFVSARMLSGVFDFKGLYRGADTIPCSLLVVFREREGLTLKEGQFVCIPDPKSDKDILLKAEKHLKEDAGFTESVFKGYAVALGQLSMMLIKL